ncbi:MAG: AraC family transcriptional regulator [Puia sp.]|nr:AraC family transcriptional regulator [Puia sp.]
MKPLLQKLPLTEDRSFVASTFRTPHFEVGWHRHIEYELILFTEGSGLGFVGNYVGEFETGDIYFLGSNLPHTFQKREKGLITSAVVIQFRENFWGEGFLQIPECRPLRQLLAASQYGLKVTGPARQKLQPLIIALETADSFRRVLLLGECLDLLARTKEYLPVSTQEAGPQNSKDTGAINAVIQFTIDCFREPITLSKVAELAHMSVPAFCHYFKRTTRKTYIDFLNEVRVGYACHLLVETEKPVLDICYESGYNTMANFHKQFLKIRKLTPLKYRKFFDEEVIRRGSNIGIDG